MNNNDRPSALSLVLLFSFFWEANFGYSLSIVWNYMGSNLSRLSCLSNS